MLGLATAGSPSAVQRPWLPPTASYRDTGTSTCSPYSASRPGKAIDKLESIFDPSNACAASRSARRGPASVHTRRLFGEFGPAAAPRPEPSRRPRPRRASVPGLPESALALRASSFAAWQDAFTGPNIIIIKVNASSLRLPPRWACRWPTISRMVITAVGAGPGAATMSGQGPAGTQPVDRRALSGRGPASARRSPWRRATAQVVSASQAFLPISRAASTLTRRPGLLPRPCRSAACSWRAATCRSPTTRTKAFALAPSSPPSTATSRAATSSRRELRSTTGGRADEVFLSASVSRLTAGGEIVLRQRRRSRPSR